MKTKSLSQVIDPSNRSRRGIAAFVPCGCSSLCTSLVLILASALAGCGQSASMPEGKNSEKTKQSSVRSSQTHLKHFSTEGFRIFNFCKEGKNEAAQRLLGDFEDESKGRAESEVLQASLAILDAFSDSGSMQVIIQGYRPRSLPGQTTFADQIERRMRLAADLDPSWKTWKLRDRPLIRFLKNM
jgi:hypothetical protein